MRALPEIDHELEHRVEDLGYELVEVRWGGSGRRPMLKLRIDRPDSIPGQGVTVDECAEVSRALESWLDEHEGLSEQYVLEVSSPGLDRPIRTADDFRRNVGRRVIVRTHEPIDGRLEWKGVLSGLEGEHVRLVDDDAGEVSISVELVESARQDIEF